MTTVGPISVATGNDDGYKASSGGFDRAGAEAYCGNIGATYTFWCKFDGVTAPQGSTIGSASLLITMSYVPGGNTVSWKCRAVDADNPASPTNASEYDAFSWTTAETTGTDANPTSLTIDVTSQMQELVDRGGYGEDKVIFQLADNGSGAFQWMYPAPYESASQEARLTVNYTAGASGPSIPVLMNQYRQRRA